MPMTATQHCIKRMHNRGITNSMIDIVQMFGYLVVDRVMMDKKQIQKLLAEINELRHQLIKMYEKGGVVVVESNGILITAFAIQDRVGKIKKKYKKAG
jgi:hypothetical protein